MSARELATRSLELTRAERDLLFLALVEFSYGDHAFDCAVYQAVRDKLWDTEVDLYEYWDCKGPDDPDVPSDDVLFTLPVSLIARIAQGGQS